MIKLLPMIMAGLYFLNTVLSYFYMDYEIISYVSGIGILPLLRSTCLYYWVSDRENVGSGQEITVIHYQLY